MTELKKQTEGRGRILLKLKAKTAVDIPQWADQPGRLTSLTRHVSFDGSGKLDLRAVEFRRLTASNFHSVEVVD